MFFAYEKTIVSYVTMPNKISHPSIHNRIPRHLTDKIKRQRNRN